MKKKKPDTEPPADWIQMVVAIPPSAWATFCRAAIRARCDPADVINHILKYGFEGCQLAEADEREAHATKH